LATHSTHGGKILALALLLRLLVLWFAVVRFPHDWLYSRGIELGTLAQNLLVGNGLSSPFGGSTGPTALLAPGYPALIALLFRIFGCFTFAAAMAVMAMQLLFSLLTVLMMMQVARRCFGMRAAHIAGTFWAVSLPLIWMPTIFWDTCLSTLLLVGMIALALHCEAGPSRLLWALMGAYGGAAALINPALLPALLALLGWAAWQTRRACSPLLGWLVLLLVYAPWPIRNERALGAFIPLRSTVGLELWMGNRDGATGFLDESVFPLFNRGEYDQYVAQGEAAYMSGKSALAITYIRAHWAEFLELSTLRFVRFWAGTGTKDGSVFFAVHAVLTSSLGMLGMWRLGKSRRFGLAVLFLLPLVLFPLPYYITHAEFRYRLVVDPLLTILGAYAVSGWGARLETL
jgi:4-amino-4-deoxy-L-arabinose transferase-like glycosyltransferase